MCREDGTRFESSGTQHTLVVGTSTKESDSVATQSAYVDNEIVAFFRNDLYSISPHVIHEQ